MILTREKANILGEEKNPLSATLSTTNFAYTDLGSMPDLCYVKPETNGLSLCRGQCILATHCLRVDNDTVF